MSFLMWTGRWRVVLSLAAQRVAMCESACGLASSTALTPQLFSLLLRCLNSSRLGEDAPPCLLNATSTPTPTLRPDRQSQLYYEALYVTLRWFKLSARLVGRLPHSSAGIKDRGSEELKHTDP